MRAGAVAVLAVCLAAVAPSVAGAATGDGFSIAPKSANGTTANAFPSGSAFWAGVCDLDDGVAAVGTRPGTRFPACIEQPAATNVAGVNHVIAPPLGSGVAVDPGPDGSGPDGWMNDAGDILVDGPSWRLGDVTAAAAHPDGSAAMWFARAPRVPEGATGGLGVAPDGSPRDIILELPRGVVGNPNAVPKCSVEAVMTVPTTCAPKMQVGTCAISLNGRTGVFPIYNVVPRRGKTAEFMISNAGVDGVLASNVPIVAEARTDGDFGVDAMALQVPAGLAVHGQACTFWGVPWSEANDAYRPIAAYCHLAQPASPFGDNGWQTPGMAVQGLPGGTSGGCSQHPQGYDPSWGPIKPFLTTQSECSPDNPVTSVRATTWHGPAVATADSVAPELTDCGSVPFDASLAAQATSTTVDGATGLDVSLGVAQKNDPPASVRFDPDAASGAPAYWESEDGRAAAHLHTTIVDLPAGLSVNPSSAAGLEACTDMQVGVTDLTPGAIRFDNNDPFDGHGDECPPGSVIGTVEVNTPLLEEELTGEVVLGEPKRVGDPARFDPESGQMFRLFLVIRNRDRGLVAKIYGTTTADLETGKLKATFDENPQLPFDDLDVKIKGGDRGMLALPQRCGNVDWSADLTPWTALHGGGGQPVSNSGSFATAGDCSFGFAPTLAAGMSSQQARGNGDFSFAFSRKDGEQWLGGLTAKLPTGLLASVKGLEKGSTLCSGVQAAAAACPASSRIGTVDAAAGSGTPYVLEKKGDAYLTEGYKGGEYGLAVIVPVEAGPFKGPNALDPIVVRQAIHVDRKTAQVTAVSDPFPTMHFGIPLRVRQATVRVDRPGFMLNPSDCAAKQIGADIASTEGTVTNQTNPFHASGCAGLAFKPKLALQLTGRKQVKTGKHPGIKAVVTQQGVPEAGIEKAVVRLPKSLALDVNNAQALCEFVDGTKPDIENHCPKGSIVGRARAVSPLLNDPLVGNVYFVKNVRIDPKTGNQIRTLPMIVVALRGEVNVNLKGESDTQKGKLVNTFNNVPDAPISQFNLNINGGSKGIIAVTRTRRSLINLCATGRQTAEADMDGHNGRRHDFDVSMKKPCTKAATRKAKRAAKRAAAKARAGSKRR